MTRLIELDTPPRTDEPELIHDDGQPYTYLRSSMMDVRRANRFLGGTYVVARQARFGCARPGPTLIFASRPVTFLDVATGSSDLPAAILDIAQQEKVPVRVVGLDFSAPILRLAREAAGDQANSRLVRGTAFRLPCGQASVGYVLCSLAFHDFGIDRSVATLREVERVARLGWLVNDLRRAWSAWSLFRVISATTRMNRLTRHDGPRPCSAYTP